MGQYSPEVALEEALSTEAQLEFAVRVIESDQHLRFFLRVFLGFCHVAPPSSVFDTDPIQNAYNQGIQAAGLELASMLTAVSPTLIPALMIEELTPNV